MSVSTEPTIAPGVYTIDPAHTEISFRVRHLLTRVTGSKTGSLKSFEAVLHIKVARGVPVEAELVAVRKR